MGFDNECILNIQSLAGEYFCPVCRLLVLPNEALQAQCTHLYCKPCMAYTANSTRACPYDGYLVTESDAKPLSESNKALADTINKIPVHCLYHRSGCTWQGPLLECVTHCSGCAFGNSPVVCNRCALQIVHRQVQEHAQTCPGVQPQAQATGPTQEATSANAAAMVQGQSANPVAAVPVRSQVAPQTATTVTPTQDPKQQPNPSTQGAEQWYQQQYHQYYQQFGGYEAYQQQYQQFYQQQVASQPQLYPQMQIQPQQPHLQTQAPLPSNHQAPPQPMTSHSQNQSELQSQMQQHEQPLLSIQQQAPPSQVQSVMGSQPLNQQQQIQSAAPANQQLQMQNHPSQQYPHAQTQVQQYLSQSYPQQHGQMPAYQQPQVLQLPLQGHPLQQLPPQGHTHQQLPYQGHLQQQLPPQLRPQQQQLPPQVHPQQQLPPQVHPQQQLPPDVHSQQQLLPHQQAPQGQASQQLQAQQPIPTLNPLPQSKIQKTQGVTGYQSYPPLQSHPAMQSGGSQQKQLPVRPPQTTQSIQVQGHNPQPSSQIHTPQFQHPQGVLHPPSLSNIPPAPHPNYNPNQQAGQVIPQRGVMQPVQQHMAPHIGQHQQTPFGGQHLGTAHNKFNQRGASHQLPMHPQISPQGIPLPYQSQQNAFGPNSMQPSHASPNPAGRPLMPASEASNHFALSTPVGAQVRPMQPGYNQTNMVGFSNRAPPVKNITGRQASLPQASPKMDKKNLATDAGQRRAAGMSDVDGKLPVGDHKGVTEDDKPGQTKPAANVEEAHTIKGLQASENGEATANPTATDDSAQRIGEQLDGNVGEVSADKKDDPTSDPKVEENAVVDDKANVDGHPQDTPLQQNDLEGQSHVGGGLVEHPSSSERNALHHMQRQESGFSHEGGSFKQKTAASSPLDPTPPGSLHQPNAPGRNLNQVRPQLKQSHPPHSRMASMEHLVAGVLPNAFEAPTQRTFLFDGRQSGPNLPGGTGLNGQHSDFHSNMSMLSHRDEKSTYLQDEHMKYPPADPSRRVYDRAFDNELKNSGEHITKFESYLSSGRPFGRGPFDKAVRGPSFNPADAASASLRILPHDRERGPFEPPGWNLGKLDSSKMHTDGFTSGYSRHYMERFLPRSPGREYDGLRSRFVDLHNRYPPDDLLRRDVHDPNGPVANSLPESRFPSFPGPIRQSEFDEHYRGGEHMSRGDMMCRDIFPSHIRRGELSGPGRLSNHLRMGEPGGLSSFHDRPYHGESVRPEIYGARIGEPGQKSNFAFRTYLDEATYRGDVEMFDGSRKRRAISMGWCRLCKVDCESVEGLDVHSQSREHQEMAMDMVRSIKQQNAKRQKQSSSAKFSFGNASQTRTSNSDARGNKH